VKARHHYEKSLQLVVDCDRYATCSDFGNLGQVDLAEGDFLQARYRFTQALRLAIQTGWTAEESHISIYLAALIGCAGQAEQAARLLGAGEESMEVLGAPMDPADKPTRFLAISRTREALGDATFEALRAEGRTLTLEQAVELALETVAED